MKQYILDNQKQRYMKQHSLDNQKQRYESVYFRQPETKI